MNRSSLPTHGKARAQLRLVFVAAGLACAATAYILPEQPLDVPLAWARRSFTPWLPQWPTYLRLEFLPSSLYLLGCYFLFLASGRSLPRPTVTSLCNSAAILGLCASFASPRLLVHPPRTDITVITHASALATEAALREELQLSYDLAYPPTLHVKHPEEPARQLESIVRAVAQSDATSLGRVIVASPALQRAKDQLVLEQLVARQLQKNPSISFLPHTAPRSASTLSSGEAESRLHVNEIVALHQDATIELVLHKLPVSGASIEVHVDEQVISLSLQPSGGTQNHRYVGQWRPNRKGLATLTARQAGVNQEAALAQTVAWVSSPPLVWWISDAATSPVVDALKHGNLHVETLHPKQASALRLARELPDLVVVARAHASELSPDFAAALKELVHGGAGLIFVDSAKSFGKGAWQGSTLYETLPVTWTGEMEEEEPDNALMLVIDRSGSMASDARLTLVQDAARRTAQTLHEEDWLGIVAFDDQPLSISPLQPARHRARIVGAISRLSPGGGTDVVPAIREAFAQLQAVAAKNRHMIVLSDGQSPRSGARELLQEIVRAGVTVSAVGVGRGAGQEMLAALAQAGGGRFYFSQDGTDVPQIFARDTQTFAKSSEIRREFPVYLTSNQIRMPGVDTSHFPSLHSLTKLRPRSQAEVHLQSISNLPILVSRRFGSGTVMVFASDVGAGLPQSWSRWSDFPRFWLAVARAAARQATVDEGLAISPLHDFNGELRAIAVESDDALPTTHGENLHWTNFTANDPLGAPLSPAPLQLDSNLWRADFPHPLTGPAIVRVEWTSDSQDNRKLVGILRIDASNRTPAETNSYDVDIPKLAENVAETASSALPSPRADETQLAPLFAITWALPCWLAGLVASRRRHGPRADSST